MSESEPAKDAVTPEKPAAAADSEASPQAETSARDVESVGDGITAAAANPGTTAARHDQVRQARQSFAGDVRFDGGTVLRDAISGNQYNFLLGRAQAVEPGTHELGEEFVAELRETFVAPPGFSGLRGRVVVLRAPAGSGKLAVAVWSLTGLGKVFRLSPDTHPGKLAVDGLTRSAGYLLDDLPSTTASSLTSFHLERLDAEISRLGGRLVITVRPETVFTDSGIDRYVVDLGVRPDIRQVLEKHLRWRLREERPALADELLHRTDVRQLLDAELTADAPLRKAAELARLIAAERHQPDTLVPTVRQRLSRSDDVDFTSWFDGLVDLHLQCFAISLAIFNGLPYETVADAGMQLHRKFDVAGGTAVATRAVPEAASPFGDGRASRLHKLRAKVGGADVRTSYGVVPAEVVSYADSSFPVRVLRHVWQEHDRARSGLITWLRDLGGHQSQTVRIRAATAVGVLTAIAYDHMRHEVLVRWARSNDEFRREAAAIALVGPADDHDPGLAGAVRSLVEEWSFGSSELRATSARAYGTSVGLKSLDTTLAALEKLSDDEDFDVIQAVCQSLAELVASGGPEVGTRVLSMIYKWSASRRELRRIVANLAFLLMAADLVTRRPDGVTWPSLLWFAYSDREQHQLMGRLWASALNAASSVELGLTVLDEWAALVEHDEIARRAFVGLMRSACFNSRVPARLRRHVQKWSKSDSDIKAQVTARDLVAVLPLEGLQP